MGHVEMTTAIMAAPPIQCDHSWHARGRRCWVLWYVPDLPDEVRQQSLARLVEFRVGDHVLVATADVRARGTIIGVTDQKVVIETLYGQVAVVDVAAATLIIV